MTFDVKQTNFFNAYFTNFYGNLERYDWQTYMALVYINNKGNVSKFETDRSTKKYNNIPYEQKQKFREMLKSIARGECEELLDTYQTFCKQREAFLKKQGDRYLYAYGI